MFLLKPSTGSSTTYALDVQIRKTDVNGCIIMNYQNNHDYNNENIENEFYKLFNLYTNGKSREEEIILGYSEPICNVQ